MEALEQLIADIERMARRMGAVFVSDPEKIKAFQTQQSDIPIPPHQKFWSQL